MNNYNKILSVVTVSVSAFIPFANLDAAELSDSSKATINHYTLTFAERESQAHALVTKANSDFGDKNYLDARDKYIQAKKLFVSINANAFKKQIEYCDQQIVECYKDLAYEAAKLAEKSALVNDYDEAIRLCQEAAEYYPECADVMNKRVVYYKELRKQAAVKADTNTNALIPEKETNEYEMKVLMRRGRDYVNAGLYEKAKRAYEDILLINPYNADAIQNLKAVNSYILRAGEQRVLLSRNRFITANELEWALPIKSTPKDTGVVLDAPTEKSVVENTVIENKIKSIVIPRIDCNDVSLRSAIDQLINLSVKEDPERIGINIILRENLVNEGDTVATEDAATGEGSSIQTSVATDTTDDADGGDITDEFGGDVVDDFIDPEANYTELEKTVLNIPQMQNKSIEDILKVICTTTNLRYRVEKYAVVLEQKDMAESGIETKIFPVDATAFTGFNPANTSELTEYLTNKGVSFPIGSKIVFDEKISRIIATNTLSNLNIIESICDETMNEQEPLIQIQLRVVEISQNALEALGFNYSVADSGSTPAFSKINTGMAASGATSTSATFTAGDFAFGIDINAVNQIDSTDVLASPKVTTIPGETVTIKLTREIYFVEDYDEAEYQTTTVENSDTTYIYQSIFPNFDSDAEELGISFTVTPTLDKERRLITMPLSPKISSLVGWTTYSGTTEDGLYEELKTPIKAVRELNTNVEVSDGDTIVLGGIISDNVSEGKQKIPILGDIPFIGRLFQTRSQSSAKQNLLIFVTPRLVRPDGTLCYPNAKSSNNGVAKFF